MRLIVNPNAASGRALRALPRVEQALRAHGVSLRTALTEDLDHARSLAAEAALAGEPAVAFGGDGLVGAVADALRHHPGAVLGVLPGGRGNDLARVLAIPRDPVAACAVLAGGATRPMDLGEVDGRTFVGIASAGFDSDANRIANDAPARLGSLAYAYGALRALAAWRPATLTVQVDPPGGERLTLPAYSVVAANSSCYGGGMRIAPSASLHDGRLDVVVVGQMSRVAFLLRMPRVFLGRHVSLSQVHVLHGSEAQLSADRPFALYADGDPIAQLPARVRILPDAVRVLVPAPAGA